MGGSQPANRYAQAWKSRPICATKGRNGQSC